MHLSPLSVGENCNISCNRNVLIDVPKMVFHFFNLEYLKTT